MDYPSLSPVRDRHGTAERENPYALTGGKRTPVLGTRCAPGTADSFRELSVCLLGAAHVPRGWRLLWSQESRLVDRRWPVLGKADSAPPEGDSRTDSRQRHLPREVASLGWAPQASLHRKRMLSAAFRRKLGQCPLL